MIAGPRVFTLPLFPVYRDGVLVAAFVNFTTAALFEDHLETEEAIAAGLDAAGTPIAGDAADAVTVDHFAAALLDDDLRIDATLVALHVDDFPHKADGTTKRGNR